MEWMLTYLDVLVEIWASYLAHDLYRNLQIFLSESTIGAAKSALTRSISFSRKGPKWLRKASNNSSWSTLSKHLTRSHCIIRSSAGHSDISWKKVLGPREARNPWLWSLTPFAFLSMSPKTSIIPAKTSESLFYGAVMDLNCGGFLFGFSTYLLFIGWNL
jgi:hypothetical protein